MLESLNKRMGIAIACEAIGTALLCATFDLSSSVIVNAAMYFLCVILTYQFSYAQLNPAITFALYLSEGKYKENAFIAGLIMSA